MSAYRVLTQVVIIVHKLGLRLPDDILGVVSVLPLLAKFVWPLRESRRNSSPLGHILPSSDFLLLKVIISCHLKLKLLKDFVVVLYGRVRRLSLAALARNVARLLRRREVISVCRWHVTLRHPLVATRDKRVDVVAVPGVVVLISKVLHSLSRTILLILKNHIKALVLPVLRRARLRHGR